jgi:hypothetical protein
MDPKTATNLFAILLVAFAITYLISGWYMAQKRGVLSALFWSFTPFRWLFAWSSDTKYDDNPEWLEMLQVGIIVAMGVVWFFGKAHS